MTREVTVSRSRTAILTPLLVALLLVSSSGAARSGVAQHDPARARLKALVPAIEKNLRENVIRFWYPRSVDSVNGGFTVHFGPRGETLPGGTKMIVTQARMVWLSSRLLRSPYAQAGMREAADNGFRFLRDRMWDREHGGFYWEVDPTGREVRRAQKHLYGQAFGLYALSEYYLATGNREALALATRLVDLLDAKAHDRRHGGYREFFTREWTDPPATENGALGAPPSLKLMNTHLHLMEAFTTYARASGGTPIARARLAELVDIESHAVVRAGWVACTDRHALDWTPVLDATTSRVSYGHDLENIWLIADALDALGRPVGPYQGLFRDLFAYSRTHGYDEAQGGFFDSGPRGQPADRRTKVWWTQAEALVSALTMYQLTGEAGYADVFEKTWQFVDTKQTDWSSGEWHEAVEPDGRPRVSNKATQWKAGYHNGRALIEILERVGRS
jgi:mannose/cellobiose epimerase-like protein (N-acyl-D-glucosamine 2-epimerase family)